MEINRDSYHGLEARSAFMSNSQLKSFMKCEAAAIANMIDAYEPPTTTALLVGSYVDAHFSDEKAQFIEANPTLFKKDNTLKAEFLQAESIIEYLEADPLLMRMLGGELQKIVTGEIAGVPFRGKIDCLLSAEQCGDIARDYPGMANDLLLADGCICDLKVMRDASPIWEEGRGKMSFVEYWSYDLQLSIYQRLIGKKLPCYIVCVTKENPPDKALIRIPQYMLDAAMESAEPRMAHYQALKQNPSDAIMCGRCAYCRSIKKINEAVDADEMDGAGV